MLFRSISLNGQKVSKSLGNVILPSELTEKYGVDGTRYYFLRFGPLTNDIDITLKKITEVYNADLANGLGNLVARVARLAELNNLEVGEDHADDDAYVPASLIDKYRFDEALGMIWKSIKLTDEVINKNSLWKDTSEKLRILEDCVEEIRFIAYWLKPFLPETAEKRSEERRVGKECRL